MKIKDRMQKKHNFLIKLLLLQLAVFVVFCSFYIPKDDSKKVKVIVIDPGHGGKDPGCNGVTHKEKEVALAVALKLGKLIEENMKDVKVIFTRKTDVFVELEDRAEVANENNADLFISIHCNAAGKPVMIKDKKTGKMRAKTFKNSRGKIVVVETTNPEPFGSETYVMGLKNEEGKMKVAQRENSAILLEDNYETKYQGFDPNSEESYIIMSNYTSSYVIQSASLALKIQEQYFKKAGRVDKGVHRQSIWVLWRTSMPSVLTEIGYLTNPQEEKFLGSTKGQEYLASCMFRAIRKYKDELEGSKKNYDDAIENQKELEPEIQQPVKQEDKVEEEEPVDEKKDDVVKDDTKEKEAAAIAKYNVLVESAEAEFKNKNYNQAEKKYKEALVLKKDGDPKIIKRLAEIDAIRKEEEKQKDIALENEKKYTEYKKIADTEFKNKNYKQAKQYYEKAIALLKTEDDYLKKQLSEIDSLLKKEEEEKQAAIDKENETKVVDKNDIIKNYKDKNKKDSVKLETPVTVKSGIAFKVQFATMDKEVDAKAKFPGVPNVWFYKMGAAYKYTSGSFSNFDDASKHQAKMRELGYKDCFVAAFKDGVRMDINEAKKAIQ